MADNVVNLMGRFGNQLWQISAATKHFGEGNFKAALRKNGISECIQNIQTKKEEEEGDRVMIPSYFQHKKWLVSPEIISKYIKKPKHFPQYDNIVHLRLEDFCSQKEYSKTILSKSFIRESCDKLGIDIKDLVVFTDGNKLDVIKAVGSGFKDVVNNISTLEAFWSMTTCDNLICSASTFSYWAAYLNPKQSFILPQKWPYELSFEDPNMYHCYEDLDWRI